MQTSSSTKNICLDTKISMDYFVQFLIVIITMINNTRDMKFVVISFQCIFHINQPNIISEKMGVCNNNTVTIYSKGSCSHQMSNINIIASCSLNMKITFQNRYIEWVSILK